MLDLLRSRGSKFRLNLLLHGMSGNHERNRHYLDPSASGSSSDQESLDTEPFRMYFQYQGFVAATQYRQESC